MECPVLHVFPLVGGTPGELTNSASDRLNLCVTITITMESVRSQKTAIWTNGNPAAAIWKRIMELEKGKIPRETARAILKLGFTAQDQDRIEVLSGKAREGVLGVEERAELDNYLRVNDLLTILQSKARQSL